MHQQNGVGIIEAFAILNRIIRRMTQPNSIGIVETIAIQCIIY
jgi:hypothetical protein